MRDVRTRSDYPMPESLTAAYLSGKMQGGCAVRGCLVSRGFGGFPFLFLHKIAAEPFRPPLGAAY